MGMLYFISLNPLLFKNIAHVGSFKHAVFVYIVFVYLCLLHLIHGDVIFDILEPPAFQKYSTCWVFQAFFWSTFFYMYFAIQPRPALTAVRNDLALCHLKLGHSLIFLRLQQPCTHIGLIALPLIRSNSDIMIC